MCDPTCVFVGICRKWQLAKLEPCSDPSSCVQVSPECKSLHTWHQNVSPATVGFTSLFSFYFPQMEAANCSYPLLTCVLGDLSTSINVYSHFCLTWPVFYLFYSCAHLCWNILALVILPSTCPHVCPLGLVVWFFCIYSPVFWCLVCLFHSRSQISKWIFILISPFFAVLDCHRTVTFVSQYAYNVFIILNRQNQFLRLVNSRNNTAFILLTFTCSYIELVELGGNVRFHESGFPSSSCPPPVHCSSAHTWGKGLDGNLQMYSRPATFCDALCFIVWQSLDVHRYIPLTRSPHWGLLCGWHTLSCTHVVHGRS